MAFFRQDWRSVDLCLDFSGCSQKAKTKVNTPSVTAQDSAAPALGETTSRFAQIAKTAIWLSGRLWEEAFEKQGAHSVINSDLAEDYWQTVGKQSANNWQTIERKTKI